MIAPPIVELSEVSLTLAGRAVLSGVSFAVRPGEAWGLLGANGSGKSTLLRVLRGEVWPTAGRRVFRLDGRAEATSPIGVRERVGLVSPELQQAYARRDWDLPVEGVVRSGFTDSVWPPEAATPAQAARVAEVLRAFDLAHLAGRSMLALSSGEARRVILARALVGDPALLFLDEPCHGLDRSARAAFLAHVSRIAACVPVVLATHRLEEVVPEIRQVAVIHGGRLLAAGEREAVLRRHRPRGPAARPAPDRAGVPRAPETTRPVLVLDRVDVKVEGRPALRDVTWTVRAGEGWAVVGPNGAGKSTLLRLLVGEEQAAPGGRVARLELGDRACVWEVKARVGLVSPELQARHRSDLPAEDVVASGFTASVGLVEEPTAAQRARARACMEALGVAHLAGRTVHAVSYGELRRLLLARALVRDPELLVLDEPCDGLDVESREAVLAEVQALCGTRAVVLVSHHEEDLVPGLRHLLALEGGRVVYAGPRAGAPPHLLGAVRREALA